MIALLSLWLALQSMPSDALRVDARLGAPSGLDVGAGVTAAVEVQVSDEWSQGGRLAPVLQLELPRSVELLGDVLKDPARLAQNDFMRAPFERILKNGPNRIPGRIIAAPGDSDLIAMNVLVYVQGDQAKSGRLVRRRIELPLKAGAVARTVPADKAPWGDGSVLAVGDRAPDFELPRADGSKFKLSEVLGKKNIVLTTYRAFW